MEAQHQREPTPLGRYRSTGIFLAGANLLFLIAIAWHGVVHPFAGATAQQALPLIQERASSWFMMHFFFAFAAVFLAASALGVLSLRSYLTASLPGLVGWSVLAIIVTIGAGLAIMEATVQGDAAVAGNLETFAMWYALSRGVELLFILFPLAFLAITVVDLRAPTPMTPRWASALALVGAALVIPVVVGASGFRLVAFGRLWAAAALPMLWFIWLGVRLASPSTGSGQALAEGT